MPRCALPLLLLLLGCRAEPDPSPAALEENWRPQVLDTSLFVDDVAKTGLATLELESLGEGAASLDVSGLDIEEVLVDGEPADWLVDEGRLDLALSPGAQPLVEIAYRFEVAPPFEGLMDSGSTLTWPSFCGNLFPCRPHPSEGSRLHLELAEQPGTSHVFAGDSVAPAPAYQLAWARGEYTRTELGTSDGGTTLAVWTLPGGLEAALLGAADLLAVFSWFEATLGPYPFGEEAGAVSVEWGPGAFGGMEHHPLWHVATGAMSDPVIQAHEAAHGWFGDGVRIACWEDLVLSEGTVTWLAARALGEAVGPAREQEVWDGYGLELNSILNGPLDRDYIVWPQTCGEVDVLDGLFGRALYLKGAFFYRDVAEQIGVQSLQRALASVFAGFGGGAARMSDVLAAIEAESGFDPSVLAQQWLRTEGGPPGWQP